MGRKKVGAEPTNKTDAKLEEIKFRFGLKTDEDLVKLLGINISTIRSWRMRDSISLGNLLVISQRTGIPLPELQGETPEDESRRQSEVAADLKQMEDDLSQLFALYENIKQRFHRIKVFCITK